MRALADRVHRLPRGRAAAWSVTARGAQRRRAGHDVIDLGVGDPDLATPAPVVDALERAIRAGRTHYAPAAGEAALRAAVADETGDRTGHAVDPEQVVVFPGAQAALYATLQVLAGPGDEVLLLEPAYTTYELVVAAAGATPVSVPLDPATGFDLDVDVVTAAMTPRTAAVMVNSPGNPSGAVFDHAALARLTAACAERGVWCVADEVYGALMFDGAHASPLAAPAGPAVTILVDSLSKCHAMTGWRLGWAVAPPAVAAALATLAASLTFGVNQFVQDAATLAVRERAALAAPIAARLRRRRDRLVDALAAVDGLVARAPAGGMFVFADVAGTGLDGEAFADALLDAEDVVVVPGSGFGRAARHRVRLALTVDEDRLAVAAARMRRLVTALRPQPD